MNLVLGLTPAEQADAVEQHLASCGRCVETLNGMRTEDTLLSMLRSRSPDSTPLPEELVAAAMERLAQLRPEPRAITLDTHTDGDSVDAEVRDMLAPAQAADELGRLGSYRILEVLGSGGMGVVFRAEDIQLRRHVALKTLKAKLTKPTARERFLREARLAASLENDHIVPIFQVGEERGVPFLAMPLLKGESLEERLDREQRLPLAEALRFAREIAVGLAVAHDAGLIHRDIKPGNIWLEQLSDGRTRVKILDFGLARQTSEEAHLTQSGMILGTPAYMAPEQARGETIDGRADLFALGCVLYRMVTGCMPFKGVDMMSILLSVSTDTPVAAMLVNLETPTEVSDLLDRLLAKNPQQRPASAQEVVKLLARCEQQLTVAQPRDASAPRRDGAETRELSAQPASAAASRQPRRSWWIAAGLFAGAAALVAGIIVIIRDRDGNEVGRYKVPEGGSAQVASESTSKQTGKAIGKLPAITPTGYKLDPALIPAAERFAWQPKELVAVVGTHQAQTWSPVSCVELNADSTLLVANSGEQLIRVWDAKTLKLHTELKGEWAKFTPDGKNLLLSNNGVSLWEAHAGGYRQGSKLLPAVTYHRGNFAVADTLLVGATGNSFVGVDWRKPTAKPRFEIADTKTANLLGVTVDGQLLVARDGNDKIRLWDLRATPPRELEPIQAQQFGAVLKGSVLVLTNDKVTRLLDLTSGSRKEIGLIQGQLAEPTLSADGKTLAARAHNTGDIHVFDLSGGQVRKRTHFAGATSLGKVVLAMALSTDGKLLATGLSDMVGGGVRVWDLAGAEPREHPPLDQDVTNIRNLTFTRDGTTLAVSNRETIRIFDVTGQSPREKLKLQPKGGANTATLAPNGASLVGVYPPFFFWDLASPQLKEEKRGLGPVGDAHTLARYSPDGQFLATPATDSKNNSFVSVWTINATGRAYRFDIRHAARLGRNGLAFAPDSKTLAVQWNDDSVRLYDIAGDKPREVASCKAQGSLHGFSADGTMLHCGKDLWDWTQAGLQKRPNPTAGYERSLLTADGKRVVVVAGGGLYNLVQIWDILTEKEIQRQQLLNRKQEPRWSWTAPGPVTAMALSPDGRLLVLGNANGTVYFLNMPAELTGSSTHAAPVVTPPVVADEYKLDPALIPAEERFPWQPKELLAVLGTHRTRHWDAVTKVSFNGDGSLLVSGGEDRYARVWDTQTMTLRAELESKLYGQAPSFAPDGKSLLVVNEGVHLWEPHADGYRKVRQVCPRVGFDRGGYVTAGNLLVGGTPDGFVGVALDDPMAKIKFTVPDTKTAMLIGLTSDGKTLVAREGTGKIRLWDMSGTPPREHAPIARTHHHAVVNGNVLVVRGHDAARLFDLAGGTCKELEQLPGIWVAAALTADGRTLALLQHFSYDIFVYELREGKFQKRLSFHPDAGPFTDGSLAFSRDGKLLGIGTRYGPGGSVHVWDISSATPRERLPSENIDPIRCLSFARDGKTLAIANRFQACVLDLRGPIVQEKGVTPTKGGLWKVAIAPDATTMMTTGQHLFWNLRKAQPEPIEKGPGSYMCPVAYSPNGELLAVGRLKENALVDIWRVTVTQREHRYKIERKDKVALIAVVFSPDSKMLAVQWSDGIRLYELADDSAKETTFVGSGTLHGFSPDGKLLHCGAELWQRGPDGFRKRPFPLVGGNRSIFTADNKRMVVLAGSTQRHVVEVWDVFSEKELQRLQFLTETPRPRWSWTAPGSMTDLALSPDGRLLVLANGNGTVYFLRMPE